MCKVGGPRCEDKLCDADRAAYRAETNARRASRRAELKQFRTDAFDYLAEAGQPLDTTGVSSTALGIIVRTVATRRGDNPHDVSAVALPADKPAMLSARDRDLVAHYTAAPVRSLAADEAEVARQEAYRAAPEPRSVGMMRESMSRHGFTIDTTDYGATAYNVAGSPNVVVTRPVADDPEVLEVWQTTPRAWQQAKGDPVLLGEPDDTYSPPTDSGEFEDDLLADLADLYELPAPGDLDGNQAAVDEALERGSGFSADHAGAFSVYRHPAYPDMVIAACGGADGLDLWQLNEKQWEDVRLGADPGEAYDTYYPNPTSGEFETDLADDFSDMFNIDAR